MIVSTNNKSVMTTFLTKTDAHLVFHRKYRHIFEKNTSMTKTQQFSVFYRNENHFFWQKHCFDKKTTHFYFFDKNTVVFWQKHCCFRYILPKLKALFLTKTLLLGYSHVGQPNLFFSFFFFFLWVVCGPEGVNDEGACLQVNFKAKLTCTVPYR